MTEELITAKELLEEIRQNREELRLILDLLEGIAPEKPCSNFKKLQIALENLQDVVEDIG